ncbi:MAG: CotH kinase family protein, partial [FCB group bacterium]|nr:CotH kinase family protein [FCB group bacterium]
MMYRTIVPFLLSGLILQSLFSQPQRDDSWMLYDDSQVGIIHIDIDPTALQWIYEYPQSDSLHLAQFHIQNALINETVPDIGFRLRGNTSRDAQKKSFKISFNTFVQGREFYDVDKLNLNGEHNDPTIARSKICWDWFEQIGVTTSRAAHYAVYINDEYFGLYLSVEHIDNEFIDNHFSDDTGNLWKCLWPADLTWRGSAPENYHPYVDDTRPYELKTNTEQYDYSQLARLIGIINNTEDNVFADSLAQIFHIPSLIKYFATNVLVGGWDDYWFLRNNYYLYHEPERNRFKWIPYDYDNSLGIDWFNIEWAQTNPYNFAVIDDSPRPLISRMMDDSRIRNLYTHYLSFYHENFYQLNLWEDQIDSLHSMLAPWAIDDIYRTLDYGFDSGGGLTDFDGSYDQEGYSNQHVKHSLKEFVQLRNASLGSQMSYVYSRPYIYDVDYFPKNPAPQDSIH